MFDLRGSLKKLRQKQHLLGEMSARTRSNTYISKDEYHDLVSYANQRKIKIARFKKFSGDIVAIKQLIDDIVIIANDFPKILEGNQRLELNLDYYCGEDVFATTEHHLIFLNAHLFSDMEYLQSEYELAMNQGKFVANTNYRSIIRHELGHVVANIYKFSSMEIAKDILKCKSRTEVVKYVKENLSLYSAEYEDGREIIAECFSGYYSGINNDFANSFVERCIQLKGGNVNETK